MNGWTDAAFEGFAAAHGLRDLPQQQLARMLILAGRAAETGAGIRRQPSKSIEPASNFRVVRRE